MVLISNFYRYRWMPNDTGAMGLESSISNSGVHVRFCQVYLGGSLCHHHGVPYKSSSLARIV
jgi:hypothetical protein